MKKLSLSKTKTQSPAGSARRFYFCLALMLAAAFALSDAQAKTLIAYYSYTNNIRTVATDLQAQTGADIVRIEPSAKNINYSANNYAEGSRLIAAIRSNPDDASSYPAIDATDINFDEYDMIIIAAPLWWSNMAAPMQTFLFQNGSRMAGKNIGLIVSSASSGISGVVADAKRLVPDGNFLEPNLWIRSAQTSNCHTLNAQWLQDIGYDNLTSVALPLLDGSNDAYFEKINGTVVVKGNFESVSLYDATGRQVLRTSENSFSSVSLAPGVYIARIARKNGSVCRKILIGM